MGKVRKLTENSVWKLLDELSTKKGITEIVINDPDRVFVEREGHFLQLKVDLSLEDLESFAFDVAEQNQAFYSEESPLLDGLLSDGSRVNIVHPRCTYGSPAVSIRRYQSIVTSFDNDPSLFGLGNTWVTFAKAVTHARLNVLVAGGTSSGKTTLLNLLLKEINPSERVVLIEDTPELHLSIPNMVQLGWSRSEGYKNKILPDQLVQNTLRMRPDRIIVGELRGKEAFDFLVALNTGHDGSFASVHANSSSQTLTRFETLCSMVGEELPLKAIRRQMSTALNFIFQVGRNRDGLREVVEILEITGMEGETISSQVIAFRPEEGASLIPTGIIPKSIQRLEEEGLSRSIFSK